MKCSSCFLAAFLLSACLTTSVRASPALQIDDKLGWNQIEVQKVDSAAKAARSHSLDDKVEDFLKSNEVSFDVPIIGSKVTLAARNFDNDEVNLKLNFGKGQVEGRKKSKLKKIFVPILVFILLKAMTLIPLALGILGIKTWNAIQLAFVSFIAAISLAVFKLSAKVIEHPPHFLHNGWEPHLHHDLAARSDEPLAQQVTPQQMAYNAYAPQ